MVNTLLLNAHQISPHVPASLLAPCNLWHRYPKFQLVSWHCITSVLKAVSHLAHPLDPMALARLPFLWPFKTCAPP